MEAYIQKLWERSRELIKMRIKFCNFYDLSQKYSQQNGCHGNKWSPKVTYLSFSDNQEVETKVKYNNSIRHNSQLVASFCFCFCFCFIFFSSFGQGPGQKLSFMAGMTLFLFITSRFRSWCLVQFIWLKGRRSKNLIEGSEFEILQLATLYFEVRGLTFVYENSATNGGVRHQTL